MFLLASDTLLLSVAALGGAAVALLLVRRSRRRRPEALLRLSQRGQGILRKLDAEIPEQARGSDSLAELAAILDALERGIDVLIEQRQQREREVMRADQLAMVGQVAAGFAHEIRNPLTAVKMLVQASQQAGRPPLAGQDLDVIEHEIRRMERSLQRFLDFARPPRPERRPIDIRLVLGRVLTLLQTRADRQSVSFLYQRPELPVIVDADEDQIQQLILNLVMNALDAMPSSGEIACTLARAEEGLVQLRVADTGPGIPPDLLPRLFEPFMSTKETGIGLGLPVSMRIAENHGGTLTAQNRREGGACFTVCLPETHPPLPSSIVAPIPER